MNELFVSVLATVLPVLGLPSGIALADDGAYEQAASVGREILYPLPSVGFSLDDGPAAGPYDYSTGEAPEWRSPSWTAFMDRHGSLKEQMAVVRKRIANLQSYCPFREYLILNGMVSGLQANIDRVAFESDPASRNAEDYEFARNNIANAQALTADIELFCQPEFALARMRDAAADCDMARMTEYRRILAAILAGTIRDRTEALSAGSSAALTGPHAEARVRAAQVALEEADRLLQACKMIEDAAEEVQPTSVAIEGGGDQAVEAAQTDRCEAGSTDPDCARWQWLLGPWTNPRYGGRISFRLQGDTVSAYVVSANDRMEREGYFSGTQILRGLKYGGQNQGTWAWHAEDGEVYEARKPGREPNEVLGVDRWLPNGLVFIERERPGVLHLPSQIEGRMSNYVEWVR